MRRPIATEGDQWIEWLEGFEHLDVVIGTENREGAIANQEVRADRGYTVDASGYRLDGTLLTTRADSRRIGRGNHR